MLCEFTQTILITDNIFTEKNFLEFHLNLWLFKVTSFGTDSKQLLRYHNVQRVSKH